MYEEPKERKTEEGNKRNKEKEKDISQKKYEPSRSGQSNEENHCSRSRTEHKT
jgi:hypothetical protein